MNIVAVGRGNIKDRSRGKVLLHLVHLSDSIETFGSTVTRSVELTAVVPSAPDSVTCKTRIMPNGPQKREMLPKTRQGGNAANGHTSPSEPHAARLVDLALRRPDPISFKAARSDFI